jgi:hypothetical protein
MDFHVAAVERNLLRSIGCTGDGREYPLPNAALAPAGETIVDGLVRPILARAISPATADLLHMHDTAQNPSVVVSRRSRLIGRQVWRNLRPLLIGEPKQACVHGLASESVGQPIESPEC